MRRSEEAMELFKKLTPENQANLLACTRLAFKAECSVKRSFAPIENISSGELLLDKQVCRG